MCKVISVTNSALCAGDFLQQIKLVAYSGVDKIILREKQYSSEEYYALAKDVMEICKKANVQCILHSFVDIAIELKSDAIHLPLPILKATNNLPFNEIGASVHSVEEATQAVALGATYLTAGHIFTTDCKKGVPPRGTKFLAEICSAVNVPVYAIGGITTENAYEINNTGASGVCLMSPLMKDDNPKHLVAGIKNILS